MDYLLIDNISQIVCKIVAIDLKYQGHRLIRIYNSMSGTTNRTENDYLIS